MNDKVIRSLTGPEQHPELTFRRRYRATAAEVRAAVTDPRRLARWFGAVEGEPSDVGDAFTARLSEEPDDVATGSVLHCEERVLAVSWTWQGEPESVITARIEPVSRDETELVIVHELREAAYARGYGGGWEQMLTALDRSLSGEPADRTDAQIETDAVARWTSLTRQALELEHRVDASVEQVWDAFASADGLAAWWWSHWADVRVEADVRVDGAYRIVAPGAGIVLAGRYLVVEPQKRLAFTWEWSAQDGATTDEAVDLRFSPSGTGGCLLTIRHTGPWPDDGAAVAYRQGWESTLPALDRLLSEHPPPR